MSRLLETVLQNYAKALGVPIHVYAPSSHFSPPRWDGGLHLHFFALPARPNWNSLRPATPDVQISSVFSWTLAQGKEKAFAPGELFSQGVLKHDQKGYTVAGILGENVYVLFDLLGQTEELVPIILRRTLDLCLEGVTETLSHWTGRPPHHLQVTLERLRHTTTMAILNHRAAQQEHPWTQNLQHRVAGVAEQAECIQRQIALVEDNLKELSRQMAAQTRLLGNCRQRLRTLQTAELSEETLVREFDGLLHMPGVRDVQVMQDRLRVFTDTVDTEVGGKRHRLGRFRVDIGFNGDVAIRNLTRPYGYYDHPHVWNARPCLGNIRQSLLRLVSEFQWVVAAELLLEYLKTVNPKGWYVAVDHWEEVRP
ncbi:MAG: hypothetical protein ACE5I9_01765 [Candidatus Methylomirabilales bacterium]